MPGPQALQDGLSQEQDKGVAAGAHSLDQSLPSYVILGPLLSIMVPLSSFPEAENTENTSDHNLAQ